MKVINRVKKYREFKEILNKRRFTRNELFTLYFRNNDYGFARVGLLVTKKNGNAVTRVKIKRQVRSICDEFINYKQTSKDIIIVISKRYQINEFQKNRALLKELIDSIKEK